MENKKLFLFQGDSITDCGRREDPEGLGNGYVRKLAAWLQDMEPGAQVVNRGVGGDRTKDLLARWEDDCIALEPDVLTIYVGINDCWRKYDSDDETPIDVFEGNYRTLLSQAKDRTKAALILMEPFVLPYPDDRRVWRKTLDPMITVVRGLAREYAAGLVTLDADFACGSIGHAYTDLSEDGVHPTDRGHLLIAKKWKKAYEKLKRR